MRCEVDAQRAFRRPEGRQVLPRRHLARTAINPSEDHSLPNCRYRQLVAQRRRRCGKGRHARDNLIVNTQGGQTAYLFRDGGIY